MKNRKEYDSINKRNIKLIIMYDGSGYEGWQRLGKTDKLHSIQTALEACLSECLKEEIKMIGSGRTDAGAHALGQVANFHCYSKKSVEEMCQEFNCALPNDIAIQNIEEVGKTFHSRFLAITKTYEYRIDQGETQSVFTRKYSYHVKTVLNLGAMVKAATYLVGTYDFKAFSTDRKDGKSTIRTIESINIENTNAEMKINQLRITITGDGFLYNMVRIIVGTLLEIGEGMKRPEDMKCILESKNRQKAGNTISSQGLFLVNVRY